MVGLAFATAALIIVLSVFNGLEGLLRSLYSSFDPEIKIEATQGKSFEVTEALRASLKALPGVQVVTDVIEDYAYVRYRDADMVATIKGVGNNFMEHHRLDGRMVKGEFKLTEDSVNYAVIGRGVQYALSVAIEDDLFALQVFYIKNPKSNSVDPSSMYSRKAIRPAGVFSIEKNFDENYIFMPLTFVEDLLDYGNKRTALEVKLSPSANPEKVRERIQSVLGKSFNVLTREEQQKDLYRLLKIEKLFTFLAFSLLIAVASINIFFSLMMLAIEKKKDITILAALGANQKLIRNIFLTEGAIISCIGAGAGLLFGGVLCWLQSHFGLVSMGMDNAIISNYPVTMVWSDFTLTSVVIVAVTVVTSFYPASLAARTFEVRHL